MLRLYNVETYYGNVQALFDVSIEVRTGEMIALIGANGAGKTTTLKTICGLLKPRNGSVQLLGEQINCLRAFEIVQKGVVLCPEGRHVFPQLSVMENILMGAFTRKDKNEIARSLQEIYEYFPILFERKTQAAGTLSGGQQQMLAIARALMANPKVLMLDEPSLGLAPVIVQQVARIIMDIHKRGVTILLVEQNARLALHMADRAYVLENGRVAISGNARDLLQDQHIRKIYLGG